MRLLSSVFVLLALAISCSPTRPPINGGRDGNVEIVQSVQADKYVGKSVTVEVKRASCSYQPRTKGSPTFCNDAPYPNHNFTMLVWGSNRKAWSSPPESWDGKCFRVKGMVTTYRGKPQIEAKESSQVLACPGQ